MLSAIRLKDFRSFADSGLIELSDLNVFLGPNSAGKSALMTVIELALNKVCQNSDPAAPLDLDGQPAFASFDSLVRHLGVSRATRPRTFALEMGWRASPKAAPYWGRYQFAGHQVTGAAFVERAEYGRGQAEPEIVVVAGKPRRLIGNRRPSHSETYRVEVPAGLSGQSGRDLSFDGYVPWIGLTDGTKQANQLVRKINDFHTSCLMRELQNGGPGRCMVLHPHRPVPRSVYVLDDPTMSETDRDMITEMLEMWSETGGKEVRQRVKENLRVMQLAAEVEVRALSRGRRGPGMVEVRIAPHRKRQFVTVADVGYGVSQVLPLLSREAQLTKGSLLAYQPEVHLHPLSQSRLADVFVGSVLRGNRVYVETHSEHLVLRLQGLIAAGDISPQRVRVFCVEHDGTSSTVRVMVFDDRGVPKERWPQGFLDTGLSLARDLAATRLKK